MSYFICPVCKKNLIEYENKFSCENNHCFDKAKQGYVNLLMSQQSSQKRHGDDKLMVKSRRDFLNKGFYSKLCDEICNAIDSIKNESYILFDIGCGEGYYTSHIKNKCNIDCVYGIDISKNALQYAGKAEKSIKYAVASAYQLPFSDNSANILINIFAPCAYNEFHRVLKDDGYLVKVVPLSEHLWELKKAIYDEPYKNKPEIKNDDLFTLVESRELKYNITLTTNEDIYNLFTMTPYYYKTSKQDAEKLFQLETLATTVHFAIEIYKAVP
ncbi:MAG: methyltransferase domain-containing protein [Ruminococcaceae bacterium]|nr:methyltransferase domain-containing protein [Oscillospiraceae bacterium]